jgi:hypothetical protein
VFLQVQDAADPNLPLFLRDGAIVRIDGAFSVEQQLERVALGAQILQGNTPWIRAEYRGPAQPLRPLDASLGEIVEPGSHVVLRVPDGDATGAQWREMPAGKTVRWSTLPSVGAESGSLPCLAAAVTDDDEDSFAICRDKVRAPRTRGAPLGSGAPDAEALRLVLRVCRAGECGFTDVAPTGDAEQIATGVMIGLEVAPRDGGSCARALAAADVGADGTPTWLPVGDEQCFARRLAVHGPLGLSVEGRGGPVTFAGTRFEVDGRRTDP